VDKNKVIFGFIILVGLALYTSVVFTFFNMQTGSRMMFMLLTALPPCVVLMMFPRLALVVLALLICSVRWMYDWLQILPREATWLSDILIVVLGVRTILFMAYQRRPLAQIERLVLLIFAFAIFTSLTNHVSRSSFIAGTRFGFRYVLLFVSAYHLNMTPKWLKGYIGLLFFIAIAQLPVIALQFQQVGWRDPDKIYGTFGIGGTTGMGLFLLVLVIYIFAQILERNKIRLSHVAIIGLLSIPAILGEIKFFFLFIPVLLAIMMRKTLRKKPGMAVGLFLFAAILIGGVSYFVTSTGAWSAQRSPIRMLMSIPQQFQRGLETAEYGRFDRAFMYVQAVRMGWQYPKNGLIGYGVGSVTDSYAFGTASPTMEKFSRWQMTSQGTMGFIWLFLEYGFVGLLLFLRLLWMIFQRAKILLASENQDERIYGRLLEGITATYVMWNFYGPAWQLDSISFSFWPLAGILVSLSFAVEARHKLAAKEKLPIPSGSTPVTLPAV
jgi:hypothetical protein